MFTWVRLGEWLVAKVHERRDVDRGRCRSVAPEQEWWSGRVLRDGDRLC